MHGWTGNTQAAHATNQRNPDAEKHDYYATDARAVELLLEQETFTGPIWEPTCGEGHISEVLKSNGLRVYSSDLIDRGYGCPGLDFMEFEGDNYQWYIKTAVRRLKDFGVIL